jgi:hypothetical protein
MQKLKLAAAQQLQNFKKKVATARAAELEKIRKETKATTRAKVLQEEETTKSSSSNNSNNEDVAKLKQELQNNMPERSSAYKKKCKRSMRKKCNRSKEHYPKGKMILKKNSPNNTTRKPKH